MVPFRTTENAFRTVFAMENRDLNKMYQKIKKQILFGEGKLKK